MQQLPMIRSGGDREAGSSQGAVISRHQNRQSFIEHRHNLEVSRLAAKPRGVIASFSNSSSISMFVRMTEPLRDHITLLTAGDFPA